MSPFDFLRWSRVRLSFRTNVVSGALALAPLGVVLWVLIWLWSKLLSLRSLLPQALDPRYVLGLDHPLTLGIVDVLVTFVFLILLVLFLAGVGAVSRQLIGQRILAAVERFVEQIPVLRTIYSTLEQLIETFSSSQGKNFKKVVMIEYPKPGLYSLAFVTGERSTHPLTGAPEKCLLVFVPTTPNPTSGFLLTVRAQDAVEQALSVEEALKQVISLGMVQ